MSFEIVINAIFTGLKKNVLDMQGLAAVARSALVGRQSEGEVYHNLTEIELLRGQTVVNMWIGQEEISFSTESGETFRMYHDKVCCDKGHLNGVSGGIGDLLFSPLLLAMQYTAKECYEDEGNFVGSANETAFIFTTEKGSVVISWKGSAGEHGDGSADEVTFTKVGGDGCNLGGPTWFLNPDRDRKSECVVCECVCAPLEYYPVCSSHTSDVRNCTECEARFLEIGDDDHLCEVCRERMVCLY